MEPALNLRLALHLAFSACFALSAHPLAAMTKDGKTMIVTLCSEPGVYRTIEIPLGQGSPGEDGRGPQNQPAGETKACHVVCCTRRTTTDEHCPA